MTTLKYKDAGVWKYLPLGGPSSVPIDTWTTIAGFANNWSAYPGYPPQYRKRPDGIVELRGLIRNGNNGQDCWGVGSLPADCCPDSTVEIYFTTMAQGPSSTMFHHDCYIRPNGTLRSLYASWGAQQSGYFSLDGIRYSTAQTAFPTGPAGPKGDPGGNATANLEGWHTVGAAGEPAFMGAWVNYGGGEQTVQFRKDPFGKVQLRGLVKSGTTTAIFTLPVGFRPPAGNPPFSCLGNNGSTYGVAQVYINTASGEVRVNVSPFNVMVGGNAYVSLEGVEFDTDVVTSYMVGPQGPAGPAGGNATVSMDTWHTVGAAGEPAFGTGWGSYGGGEPAVGYRKDPLGWVHLKGLIVKTAPANGDVLFTLPVGWRPPTGGGNLRFLVPYSSSTIGVYVNQATGDLRLWYGAQANLNIDLSVIEFDTETVTAMPTGPQGPQGIPGGQRAWRGLATGGILSTQSASYAEISTGFRIAPTPTPGSFVEFNLSGQWEHNTIGGYFAVQLWDVTGSVWLANIYWMLRAAAASANVSFYHGAVVPASAFVSGHVITPYWSTGSGTCYLRSDTVTATFTAKELTPG